MGTYVALQLALRYPHLVTHLVLVAATGGIDVGVHGAKDWRQEYASAFLHAQDWALASVPDLSDRLSDITLPVLLIWPTHDTLSPLPVAQALASKIPFASLVTFPSNDHWLVHRFSDESASAIRSFVLRGIGRRAIRRPPTKTEQILLRQCRHVFSANQLLLWQCETPCQAANLGAVTKAALPLHKLDRGCVAWMINPHFAAGRCPAHLFRDGFGE